MAFQSPAFYFFHALREAGESNITFAGSGAPANAHPLHDGRLGELAQWTTDFASSSKHVDTERADTPANDAIDTVILTGHNISGNLLNVRAGDGATFPNDMLSPDYNPITEANGVTIVKALTASVDVSVSAFIRVTLATGVGSSATVPELSELFLTTKRTPARGPEPNWNHSPRRTQRTFLNDAGVTSTRLLGPARKTWRMTWRHLFESDRQIFLDLIDQTNDLSEPFWFLPPDDIYPIQYVELDRDSDWQQDFMNPIVQGTSDRVTLPMIQVLG